jgi:hypothetical protein
VTAATATAGRSRLAPGLLAFVLPVAVASCGGDESDEPFAFTSPENEFSVTFPGGEPEREATQAPLPDGTTTDLVLYSSGSDGVEYATARTAFPAAPPDAAAALEGARDGSISQTGGSLVDSAPIELSGRPGMQFTATLTSNGEEGTVLSRLYLQGNVMYQVMTAGEGDLSFDDPEIAAFFDSFQFNQAV